MNLYFTHESRDTLTLLMTIKTITKLNLELSDNFKIESSKISPWSFHVNVVLQRTAKKCTKRYNARAQLLFYSLNLLFGDVPVAVAVVVFLNSLLSYRS